MKTVITENFSKAEFFLYYIFMVVFCSFITYNSIAMGGLFLICSVLSGAGMILSIVILYSYFYKILDVKYLLIAYITICSLFFIASAILEIITFHINWYPLFMKISLYCFCLAVPIKHLMSLTCKLDEYKRLNNGNK